MGLAQGPCGGQWLRAQAVLAEDPGLTSSTLGTPAPGKHVEQTHMQEKHYV